MLQEQTEKVQHTIPRLEFLGLPNNLNIPLQQLKYS